MAGLGQKWAMGNSMSTVQGELIREYANVAADLVAADAVAALKSSTATLSGDDSGLDNTWDEICVQVQGEESFYWDAYLYAMRDAVLSALMKLEKRDQAALWLQTENGWNWHLDFVHEDEGSPPSECGGVVPSVPVSDEEIAEYIIQERLLAMAEDYTNEHITAFLNHGEDHLEIDDGEDGIDASDLSPQFPFHVSVSDRLASNTEEWDPSGDYATLEEAIAAAKKIVDDQLEADFRKNSEDRPLMLLDGLLDFGFIPCVTGPGGKSLFNARGYAEKKCYELKGMELPRKLVWGESCPRGGF